MTDTGVDRCDYIIKLLRCDETESFDFDSFDHLLSPVLARWVLEIEIQSHGYGAASRKAEPFRREAMFGRR